MIQQLEEMSNTDLIYMLLNKRDILMNKGYYGPYSIQVPEQLRRKLYEDYMPDVYLVRTLYERILQIEGITEIRYRVHLQDILLVPLDGVQEAIAEAQRTIYPCEHLDDL